MLIVIIIEDRGSTRNFTSMHARDVILKFTQYSVLGVSSEEEHFRSNNVDFLAVFAPVGSFLVPLAVPRQE